MNTNKFDIIIVGGGPAGLACALEFKNTSYSVLLLEKNDGLGPKPCAGGLTGLSNNYPHIPGEKTSSFFAQNIRINKSNYRISLKQAIRTISRFDLAQYQLEQLKEASNIRILINCKIVKIDDEKVYTNTNECFYYTQLVGADGANSVVRKHVGLASNYCIGLYYEIPKVSDNCLWFLSYKKMKTGYIWVFPHKSHTNIGIYFNPQLYNAQVARKVLEEFCTKEGFNYKGEELQGGRVCYTYQGHQFKTIFLVGEAAGLCSKGTGEGISHALLSGKETAKIIQDPSYNSKELKKTIQLKLRQDKLFSIVEKYPFMHAFLYIIFLQLMRIKRVQAYFGI